MLRHDALGASFPAAIKVNASNRLLVDRWRVLSIVMVICIIIADKGRQFSNLRSIRKTPVS